MNAIVGQKVRLPNNCKCGCELATVGPGNGKFYATLTCSCGRNRGSLTEFTGKWIETVAAKFGAPATIVLRRAPIPPVEAEQPLEIPAQRRIKHERSYNHKYR
jgi:hypothetical protein